MVYPEWILLEVIQKVHPNQSSLGPGQISWKEVAENMNLSADQCLDLYGNLINSRTKEQSKTSDSDMVIDGVESVPTLDQMTESLRQKRVAQLRHQIQELTNLSRSLTESSSENVSQSSPQQKLRQLILQIEAEQPNVILNNLNRSLNSLQNSEKDQELTNESVNSVVSTSQRSLSPASTMNMDTGRSGSASMESSPAISEAVSPVSAKNTTAEEVSSSYASSIAEEITDLEPVTTPSKPEPLKKSPKPNKTKEPEEAKKDTKTKDNLKKSQEWKEQMLSIIQELENEKISKMFKVPISEETFPGYQTMINNYLDFPIIKKRLENDSINSTLELYRDVLLMCQNAMTVSKPESTTHKNAEKVKKLTTGKFEALLSDSKPKTRRSSGSSRRSAGRRKQ